MNLGYHPDYGYSDEVRVEAVYRAKATSVVLAAAEFKVSSSSIYRWLKVAEKKEESK